MLSFLWKSFQLWIISYWFMLVLCISTSFQVLAAPARWPNYFFQPFSTFFCWFSTFFNDFMAENPENPEINNMKEPWKFLYCMIRLERPFSKNENSETLPINNPRKNNFKIFLLSLSFSGLPASNRFRIPKLFFKNVIQIVLKGIKHYKFQLNIYDNPLSLKNIFRQVK